MATSTAVATTPGPYFLTTDTKNQAQLHVGTCPEYVTQIQAGASLEIVEFEVADAWICTCIQLAINTPTNSGFERARRESRSADEMDRDLDRKANHASPVEPVPLPTADEVNTLIDQLGRKFEVSDINSGLIEFATEWAKNWTGTFEFMVDMNAAATKRTLSAGQAKGTLNCYRADYLRNKPVKAPTPITTPAKDFEPEHGRVYASADGRFIKVQDNQAGTSTYAKVWDTEEAEWVYAGVKGLALIARQVTAEEAAAWGHEHHKCVFCSRKLSDQPSVDAGYGSTCADKYGLPWG